jgi:hypothetical protein
VQDLINSFVRLSAAMTMYSVQQMQSAAETIDPKDSVVRFCHMIDSMTDALTAQMDDSKKATVQSLTNLGTGVVGRTLETITVNVPAINPREIVQTTADMVRKTTQSLAGLMKPGDLVKEPAATPHAAEEVLATH